MAAKDKRGPRDGACASAYDPARRRASRAIVASAAGVAGLAFASSRRQPVLTVYTFGDSILDCARYNEYGVHPGALVVANDDRLFPAFRGRDLSSRMRARLEHRAVDGSRVDALPRQAERIAVEGRALAMITIGGNDLLAGLAVDGGEGIARFASELERFLARLPIRPVLLGNVYDPTFGDDARNFLGVDPRIARANLERVNAALATIAPRYGELVDLHRHFLGGDASWFVRTIEPSLVGASEVRAAFLPAVMRHA